MDQRELLAAELTEIIDKIRQKEDKKAYDKAVELWDEKSKNMRQLLKEKLKDFSKDEIIDIVVHVTASYFIKAKYGHF
jgi:hypothetical protein